MPQEKMVAQVKFFSCGAEHHPAFSTARSEVMPNGFTVFTIEFPIHNKDLNRSHHSQEMWAKDKVRHLASWGAEGIIRWRKAD